jgi:hypothetical protein
LTIILTEHYRRLADVSQSVICFSVARAPACINILHRSCVQSRSSKPGWLLLRAAFRSKHQRRASELHGRSFPSAIKYDKAQKSYKIRIMGVILGALLFGAQAKALSHTLPLCIKQLKVCATTNSLIPRPEVMWSKVTLRGFQILLLHTMSEL